VRRVLTLLVGAVLVGGAPGVAHAFPRAFTTRSPADAVVTAAATGSVSVELGDGDDVAFATPITGLRPDDEIPDDDQPADAFTERVLTVRNSATVTTALRVGVEYAPTAASVEGLRVSVSRLDGGDVVVSDADVPLASTPIADLGPGGHVKLRVRFRLAHTAPATVMGRDTAVRVTVVADARPGGNR